MSVIFFFLPCIQTTGGDDGKYLKWEKSDVVLPVERVGNRSALPIGAACSESMWGFLG